MSEARLLKLAQFSQKNARQFNDSLASRYPHRQQELDDGYFLPHANEKPPNVDKIWQWFDEENPHQQGVGRSMDTLRGLISLAEQKRADILLHLQTDAIVLVVGPGYLTDVAALIGEFGVDPARIYIVDQNPEIGELHNGVVPPENIFVHETGLSSFLESPPEGITFDVVVGVDIPVEATITLLPDFLYSSLCTSNALLLCTTVFYCDRFHHGEFLNGWNDTKILLEFLKQHAIHAGDESLTASTLYYLWNILDMMGDDQMAYERRDIHVMVKE